MRNIRVVGLTGQSGAGKSTVADVFAQNNISIVSADELVKKLYVPNSVCLGAVAASFGSDIIRLDGCPDRKLIAQRAFADKKSTALLDSIVHPFVTYEFMKSVKSAIDSGEKVIVYDAPQLFESGSDVFCDLIVGVTADRRTRLERICRRDNISTAQAELRISAQLDEKFFIDNSDIIIENNGSLDDVVRAAKNAVAEINALAVR